LTIFQTVDEVAKGEIRTQIKNILGGFMFRGDEIDKKVSVLSGGEKTRLAMGKLLLEPINVLILDEPTNHLDIKSKNVLKQALKKFDGTLILVSHDRDFLQGLTDTVYGFKDKVIKEYLGDIDYFLEEHKMENLREAEKRTIVKEVKVTAKKEDTQFSREEEKELKKLKNKLSKIESEIADLESQIEKTDLELANNYDEVSSRPNFFEKYKAKKAKVDALMEEWESIEEKVTAIS